MPLKTLKHSSIVKRLLESPIAATKQHKCFVSSGFNEVEAAGIRNFDVDIKEYPHY